MGLAKADEKARRFVARQNIDVSDAIAVGRTFIKDHWDVMVVKPTVIEVHTLGRTGSFTSRGAGVQMVAVSRVGSVGTHREGVTGVLTVEGMGVPGVVFRGDLDTRDRLAEGVRVAMAGGGQSAPATAPPPPAVPAGWYPAGDVQRYWDGSAWTDHTAPLG